MKHTALSSSPPPRDHGAYLWFCTEIRTLLDDVLAVSTQYDWINDEDDYKAIFDIFKRDIERIANRAASPRHNIRRK